MTPHTSMSDHKRQYDRDGFVVVRKFLPPEELAELRTHLDRYIREVVPSLPSGSAFFQDRARPETLKQLQHMGHDPFFAGYREHPRWQALANELIGEPSAAKEPEWFNKPPGTEHPTPPHQDNFYFCLRPANVLTMWLALDDVDVENGCLRYVRGSHRRGIRPHLRTGVLGFSQGITDYGPDDLANEVEIHLAPGDLVVHHGETIHRAEPNRSVSRNRRAFAMVFQGESCRRDDDAFARYEAALHSQHSELGLATA
ncbi:MAG: phytanoyl-CoA dioxygenase family protein [Planctomycetaceae bacterium]